jgi:hypothetical protein
MQAIRVLPVVSSSTCQPDWQYYSKQNKKKYFIDLWWFLSWNDSMVKSVGCNLLTAPKTDSKHLSAFLAQISGQQLMLFWFFSIRCPKLSWTYYTRNVVKLCWWIRLHGKSKPNIQRISNLFLLPYRTI